MRKSQPVRIEDVEVGAVYSAAIPQRLPPEYRTRPESTLAQWQRECSSA